jgi:hypothetical protein
MAHYRIAISGSTKEAMADLVRKHKIQIFRNTVRSEDTNYVIDAIAQPN